MTNVLDHLRGDMERIFEEHESEIAEAIGMAAKVVPNPAVDGLLTELEDVVARLRAASKPADPTAPASAAVSTPADAQPSNAASGPSDAPAWTPPVVGSAEAQAGNAPA